VRQLLQVGQGETTTGCGDQAQYVALQLLSRQKLGEFMVGVTLDATGVLGHVESPRADRPQRVIVGDVVGDWGVRAAGDQDPYLGWRSAREQRGDAGAGAAVLVETVDHQQQPAPGSP
jgi:hypothetical protein